MVCLEEAGKCCLYRRSERGGGSLASRPSRCGLGKLRARARAEDCSPCLGGARGARGIVGGGRGRAGAYGVCRYHGGRRRRERRLRVAVGLQIVSGVCLVPCGGEWEKKGVRGGRDERGQRVLCACPGWPGRASMSRMASICGVGACWLGSCSGRFCRGKLLARSV